ncbi:AAA family ATPase [Streptomyces sp. NPDC044571]|uniref:AAA family ATPase n=1 Tax=Streptomyces sp. NPDC044571 TaxID=3155371 RepID=UPI0033E37C4B
MIDRNRDVPPTPPADRTTGLQSAAVQLDSTAKQPLRAAGEPVGSSTRSRARAQGPGPALRAPLLSAGTGPAGELRPRGLVDLRGMVPVPARTVVYPPGAVVVVSGLPGSGKSTLLERWSRAAGVRVVEPRVTHVQCESRMPAWLPYAVYRPWARLRHFTWLREAVACGEPLLVHDCGSRAWMRTWLRAAALRAGRTGGVHLVLVDVGPAAALSGQRSRGRHVSRRTFAGHVRGLGRLFGALADRGRDAVPEAASVVLLDRSSRSHLAGIAFTGEPHTAARDPRTAP